MQHFLKTIQGFDGNLSVDQGVSAFGLRVFYNVEIGTIQQPQSRWIHVIVRATVFLAFRRKSCSVGEGLEMFRFLKTSFEGQVRGEIRRIEQVQLPRIAAFIERKAPSWPSAGAVMVSR